MRDKRLRKTLRKYRKHDARVAQKLMWERLRKFPKQNSPTPEEQRGTTQ